MNYIITLSNLRKFTKSSVFNNIITCLFQISKIVHKNLLLYTQDEAKFAARDFLYPAMVRTSQVAARQLALRNRNNFKKVYTDCVMNSGRPWGDFWIIL